MYEDGKGTEQDIQQAIHWYKEASEAKHMIASYNLASIYYLGRVHAPDYSTAFKYFTRAASLGDERSMFQLGLMYLFGQGAVQDFE
jgi:TPR repeat protein